MCVHVCTYTIVHLRLEDSFGTHGMGPEKLNSGYLAWWQGPLPIEPSHQLLQWFRVVQCCRFQVRSGGSRVVPSMLVLSIIGGSWLVVCPSLFLLLPEIALPCKGCASVVLQTYMGKARVMITQERSLFHSLCLGCGTLEKYRLILSLTGETAYSIKCVCTSMRIWVPIPSTHTTKARRAVR